MKKFYLAFIAVALTACLFTSCSSDDEADFGYSKELLVGTWDLTHLETDGEWIDLNNWAYTQFKASISFYADGKYYGSGYFGTGSGTYVATGNKIKTYVDGKPYLTYTITSVDGNNMEGTMSDNSGSMGFKAEKR